MKHLLALLFVLLPSLAWSAIYYTGPAGWDGYSCGNAQARSTPKLTVNAGVSCLESGDTLIVLDGTYYERLDSVIPSGSSGSHTTVRAEVRGGAMLMPLSGSFTAVILMADSAYITIDGLVLDSTYATSSIIYTPRSHHITIEYCELRWMAQVDQPNGAAGLSTGPTSSFITLRHSKVHGIGRLGDAVFNPIDHGVYVAGQDNVIEYNMIYNNIGHGIHGYNQGSTSSDRNIFRKNVIFNNDSRGILVGGAGNDNHVSQNILYNNWMGILVGKFGGSARNLIYNNTIFNNRAASDGGECIILDGTTSTSVYNNICYQNRVDAIVGVNNSDPPPSNNLLGINPQFLSIANQDFRLQPDSPAIDAGISMGLPFSGTAPDIGAEESGFTPPPPPTLPPPSPQNLIGRLVAP